MSSQDINFTEKQALQMFDALSRTNSARQIKPLDKDNYITYDHRYLYDDFNLEIGDVCIMVPPEFIYVSSESFSQNIQTLRQENSQKQKTGYHKRTIQIDLVFNGMDEINGYKVPAPVHYDGTYIEDGIKKQNISNYYYVDGLRPLLAQFKLTPFLPVKNDLLNDAYKIYVVALQSIVISTIDGFQNALSAHITLQEVDMMPYIEMPNIMYRHTIDWDLFRYYTQGILTENHVYKNLQSLPVNRDHTAFKLSILNEEILASVNDKTDGTTKEETILEKVTDPESYACLIDSNDSDVHITSFQCSYANMLTSIQMSDACSPTLQYIGGLDTQFNIIFETTDVTVVGSIEQCQIHNDLMVRNNPKIRGSIGFVKIEADFVTFCGSLFCTIESVETHTVQGIPGLYQVRLLCVSYDIAQSRREELNGFLPFDGHESNISELELTGKELKESISTNATQAIDQSYEGLVKKIYQDNYAEWKLRTSMEVYPDLRLPTYDEVNEAINNINAFRKYNNKDQLPYGSYPVQHSNVIFGNNKTFTDKINKWPNDGNGEKTYVDQQINKEYQSTYNVFVDPDFYVFYPNTYLSIYNEEQEYLNQQAQSTGKVGNLNFYNSATKAVKNISAIIEHTINPIYGNGEDTDSGVDCFIEQLRTMLGHSYEALAEGEVRDQYGEKFDSLGLITWGLKTQSALPENYKRLSQNDIDSLDIFEEVSLQDICRGDIITDSSKTCHAVILGYDKQNVLSVIDCNPIDGVTEERLPFNIAHVYRVLPLQEDYDGIGTSQSNPYESDGNKFPDKNKKIKKKKKSLLETTKGYESDNPYGAEGSASYSYVNNTDNSETADTTEEAEENTEETEENNTDKKNKKKKKKNKNKDKVTITKEETKEVETKNQGQPNPTGLIIDQDLGVWSPVSERDLNAYINSHAPSGSPFINNAAIFIKAGEVSGLDPRFILAHAINESSWGTSHIAREKHNYFGIGAFDNSPYASAYTFSPGLAASVIEGAKWIADNYYNGKYGQKTLRSMRWNNGVHQYATDEQWDTVRADLMKGMPQNNSAQYLHSGSDGGSISINESGNISSDTIKLKEYERRNREESAYNLAEITKRLELDQASISDLTIPEIEDDGSEWTDGSVKITEYREMTTDEFNAIALTVATECEGETIACKMAMTQFIYDYMHFHFNGGGVATCIKNTYYFKSDKTTQDIKDVSEAEACVQRVFQAGARWKKNYRLHGFTSVSNSNYAVDNRDARFQKVGSVNQHIFYGVKEESYTIGYNIKGYGVSEVSSNSVTVTRKYEIKSAEIDDTESFGKPIYIKTSYFDSHDNSVGKIWQSLNDDKNRILTSFVDDCQYSSKGRMVKAFPAFLFCILDDQAQWYDGRKLWTNYYVYKPVIDIQYHAANDMPTETAQITVTNTYHNLDRSSAALIKYSIANDEEYDSKILDGIINFGVKAGATTLGATAGGAVGGVVGYTATKNFHVSINRWLYKNTGMLIGGLKITNRLIQMHSILFNHTKVREGARVHLRMGYGSDPLSLAPIINGTISGMTLGDQIGITVTSDGHELIQSITSDKTKDVNNGALGLFGLGSTQEAANIISGIMVKRQSWMNHLFFGKNWFEGSKYNIEHFGLYINSGSQYAIGDNSEGYEIGTAITTGLALLTGGVPAAIGNLVGRSVAENNVKAIGNFLNKNFSIGTNGGIDVGIYEQYDLLMNIYNASTKDGWIMDYNHWGYMYENIIPTRDGESNIVFNQYNMTPWDVFQLCAQTMPEFLIKVEKYQFDSRLYYGLPFDLTKYRYDIIGENIYQECKANTQMHYLDSITAIIENQVSVTSRPSFTNAKVIYTRGSTPKATAVIHSDDTIDNAKQSTHIIDSCIVQDYLGPDGIWEVVGVSKQGKVAARRLGISNLLYGWQQQYQGQLLCLGQPQIKPDDYLMINDFYTNLNGITMVREVIHSFSTSTGFTTSVIPGIIGFCPEQNSGNIMLMRNYFKLYSLFTNFSVSRKQLKENCERYADYIAMIDKGIKAVRNTQGWYFVATKGDTITDMFGIAATSTLMFNTIRAVRNIGSLKETAKIILNTTKAMKEIKVLKSTRNVVRSISVINRLSKMKEAAAAIESGALTVGTGGAAETAGISLAIAIVVCIIVDLAIDAVASWIENRNAITLLPLWWEGKPFIAGVKDGEKILLISDENSGSEENTGEDGVETDIDETSVLDN